MSVSDGQLVNAAVSNAAFVSRTQDTSTVGKLALNNSGSTSLADAQKDINDIFSAAGISGENDANAKQYSSNEVIVDAESYKQSIVRLDQEFHNSTGHGHSGAAGDGAPIVADNLTNFNKFFAEFQMISVTGAAGTTDDISTQMTGKSPGGNSTTAGVITTGANNVCHIVDASTQTFIEDAGGQRVYGRITESVGVWTLSYYTNEAGVETAHSLSSTNINVIFLEIFTQATRPTIPSNPFLFGTLDVTADVVDASTTQRGVVNTIAQSFSGFKTFEDILKVNDELVLLQTNDSTTTGADQTITPTSTLWALTNVSLTSISGITSNARNTFVVVVNKTGAVITLKHDHASATAANRILIPDAADLDWADNQGLIFVYDTTNSRWILAGGSGGGGGGAQTIFGSTGTPRSIVAATGITSGASHMSTTDDRQVVFVVGSISGESDVSANPQISNGTIVGQEMTVIGTSDSDYVLLEDGNGLRLSGPWSSFNNAVLRLLWNGTVWTEITRSL